MFITLQDIWDGIRSHVGRFSLSIAAIAIGILSLAILISVMNGLQEKSDRIVRSLGVNVIGLLGQNGKKGFDQNALSIQHAELLERNLPNALVSTMRSFSVLTAGTSTKISLVMTDNNLFAVRQWPLLNGRNIDRYDLVNRQRVVVISKSLSDIWNWRTGNVVSLGSLSFRVIGVVKVGGNALDMQSSKLKLMLGGRAVFVPRSINPIWVKGAISPGSNVDAVFIKVDDSDNIATAVQSSRQLLSDPKIKPRQVSWVTPDSLISGVQKLRNTIGVTVGGVAILCLLLGATTLASLMIANVQDRVREIGLRLALGATRREISALFVVEAGVLTTFAGIIGSLLAYIALTLGEQYIPVPTKTAWSGFLVPIGIALLIGPLSAYWPARIAAKIKPSEALRS